MSLIFLSWASSDKAIVTGLIDRLRDLGLGTEQDDLKLPTLWEYRPEMRAGDEIPDIVDDVIKRADTAVVCVSDAALAHKWIISELTLCRSARNAGTLRHTILVKVGPTTDEALKQVAHLVPSTALVADVSQGAEAQLVKLADDIFTKIDTKPPQLMPIAVIAMNEKQADTLFDTWKTMFETGNRNAVWEVCLQAGMKGPPELFAAFVGRYGARPEDMKPFTTTTAEGIKGDTLMQIIHASLRDVNRARVAQNERPIFPRWIHGELFGDDMPLRDEASALWKTNESLLVVDQMSVFDDEVKSQLANLPDVSLLAHRAALCLPPYTQHTRELEERLRKLVDSFPRLRGEFDDWKNPDRMITFDTGTSVTLRLWLHRRFLTVADKDQPVKERVNAMPTGRMTRPSQSR